MLLKRPHYRILTEMHRTCVDSAVERIGICTVTLDHPLSLGYNSATIVYDDDDCRRKMPEEYLSQVEGRIGEWSQSFPVGHHKEVIDRLRALGFDISGRPKIFRDAA